MVDAVIAD